MTDYLRTLFLHPPSFEGFDGGAGARYQARREVRSFWYPTWLAQPAALVPGSRLVDAPPAGLGLDDVIPLARDYDLAVLHTSTPSFPHDVRVAEALKTAHPALRVGFVGAHVAVQQFLGQSVADLELELVRAVVDLVDMDVAQVEVHMSVSGGGPEDCEEREEDERSAEGPYHSLSSIGHHRAS